MLILNPSDWQQYDRFYRAHLLNCLSGFKSASLIATRDLSGRSNAALFSNIVHLGADPFLIGHVNRPREATPHTLANIEATGYYTINHIHEEIVIRAHQCSAKYPEGESEFVKCGLTEEAWNELPPPYVKESRIKMGLQLEDILPIRQNNTWFVIGRVLEVRIPGEIIEADGFLPIEKSGSLCSLGLDAYYDTRQVARPGYARPKQE